MSAAEDSVDVADWFARKGIELEEVAGKPDTRRGRILGRNASWDLYVRASDDDVVEVWSLWETEFPADRLVDMVTVANRVNGLLTVPTVVVDPVRHSVGLRTSVDIHDDRMSEAMLTRLVGRNVDAFDELVLFLDQVAEGASGADIDLAFTDC
jgi:hypothetical protein